MENLTGNEEFTQNNTKCGITVNDFWRWAYSNLIDNTNRGVLAEFLVYSSFSPSNIRKRVEWEPYDVLSPTGRHVEVKAAAYLQSWTTDFPSQIRFDIAPKRIWSPTDGYSAESKRNSDLYVFCLYTALKPEQSILDLDLWKFYVLATSTLDCKLPTQKSISLSSLLKLNPVETVYENLGSVVEQIVL